MLAYYFLEAVAFFAKLATRVAWKYRHSLFVAGMVALGLSGMSNFFETPPPTQGFVGIRDETKT